MSDYKTGMKPKTIRIVLKKKFEDYLTSIEDEHVKELVKKNSIITGGCIASMLLGEKINDFDIYFTNHETVKAVADYYVGKFKVNPPPSMAGHAQEISVVDTGERVKIKIKSAGIASEDGDDGNYRYFEAFDPAMAEEYVSDVMDDMVEDMGGAEIFEETYKPRYRPIFLSANAITLANGVQLVLRFYGTPEEIHTNYDFVHCTNYWTSGNNQLVLRKEALECLLSRELRYVGSKYPIASMVRTRKFINRGFRITAGSYLKMAMQVSELDLNDFGVLEEQLTGVDVAYFMELLTKLREKSENGRVETCYVMEILDRMF